MNVLQFVKPESKLKDYDAFKADNGLIEEFDDEKRKRIEELIEKAYKDAIEIFEAFNK